MGGVVGIIGLVLQWTGLLQQVVSAGKPLVDDLVVLFKAHNIDLDRAALDQAIIEAAAYKAKADAEAEADH